MEVSLGDAIKEFLKKSKLRSGVQALQIEDAWEKIIQRVNEALGEKVIHEVVIK
jgi:hypothetical protein